MGQMGRLGMSAMAPPLYRSDHYNAIDILDLPNHVIATLDCIYKPTQMNNETQILVKKK